MGWIFKVDNFISERQDQDMVIQFGKTKKRPNISKNYSWLAKLYLIHGDIIWQDQEEAKYIQKLVIASQIVLDTWWYNLANHG